MLQVKTRHKYKNNETEKQKQLDREETVRMKQIKEQVQEHDRLNKILTFLYTRLLCAQKKENVSVMRTSTLLK